MKGTTTEGSGSTGTSRRRFIAGASALAGAAAWAGRTATAPARAATARGPVEDGARVAALVIGSGYGGCVAALRLAQAGVDVHLIEKGMSWDTPGPDGRIFCGTLDPDHRSYWLRTRTRQPVSSFLGLPVDRPVPRYTGVLDAEDMGGITVYQGRGLGGGSLVNGGMAVTPARENFGAVLPSVDAEEMYRRYYPRANAALGVATVDRDWFETAECYRYARLGREQAERAGLRSVFVPNVYDWEYMEREAERTAPRSALAGEVLYGNNHGKKSLQRTYLARIRETGRVTVSPLHEVVSVSPARDGGYTVVVHRTDTGGVVRATKTVTADKVFFAAGSVGTSKLLTRLRATGALPRLSDEVGRGWGDNGNIMCARANHLWTRTGTLQSTIPATGIDNWTAGGAFGEVVPLPTGIETHASLYLSITRNPHRAEFSWNPRSGRVELNWRRAWKRPAVELARTIYDRINTREGTGYRYDLFGARGAWGDHLTYHPLGGVVLNRATDNYGRLRGYAGLYVIDGSLIPGNTTVNPFVTITALAERNIEAIVANDL
ncbi:GMC family oxidoreductase [Streptomyces sp. NA04227]|uniref:GMC oxidoreductase n=1 Tax=Streptomyces sp. NA04227 TaxID=2742136 RepID=UPI00159223E4|nr:GMC oxidoreductase [Streptomyces sp. NA04227]QKW10410.1 GMC family oxidoreductase [Streptomyces sp. NA04227]